MGTNKNESKILQPGEDVRAVLTSDDAKDLAKRLYGLECLTIKEMDGFDDRNFHITAHEFENQYIDKLWPHGYVLKVMNSLDSQNTMLVEAQNEIMLYLISKNISTTKPVRNRKGATYSVEMLQKEHIIRLLEFQPGVMLSDVPVAYNFYYKLGKFVAEMEEVLKGYHHPVYENYSTVWHLLNAEKLNSFMYVIQDQDRKHLYTEIIDKFVREAIPKTNGLEKGIIHADCHGQNFVVKQGNYIEDTEIISILDFGDACKTYYVFEVALTMRYIAADCISNNQDILTATGNVLAGFLAIRQLSDVEYSLLQICICVRLCQSIVLGWYTLSQRPNDAYVAKSIETAHDALIYIWNIPPEEIIKNWKNVVLSCKDYNF